MAALVILAAAASQTPPAAPGITADQAMGQYRALTGAGPGDGATPRCPDTPAASQIIVCGQSGRPQPRLPMPDQRADEGEVTHHPGEPGKGDPGPPTGPPSKLGQTLGKIFGLIREAITGEDPDQP